MVKEKKEMATLTDVLEDLRVRKQDHEFKMEEKGFTPGNNKYYEPDDLTITKTYRFEGESDPADSSILYLLEASDGMVGYSLDTYGAYSSHDDRYYEFMDKVRKNDQRDESEK